MSQQQRAQRLLAALATVLAEDEGSLWPDDIKALKAAQAVATGLIRRGR